ARGELVSHLLDPVPAALRVENLMPAGGRAGEELRLVDEDAERDGQMFHVSRVSLTDEPFEQCLGAFPDLVDEGASALRPGEPGRGDSVGGLRGARVDDARLSRPLAQRGAGDAGLAFGFADADAVAEQGEGGGALLGGVTARHDAALREGLAGDLL